MIKLTILKADGTLYWTEYFNSRAEGDAWLDEETTREYWGCQGTEEWSCTFEDLTPQPRVLTPQEQYEADLSECRRLRAAAYPPVGDQLDAMYKRDALGVPGPWADICDLIAAVKARFPKPVPPS